MKNTQISFNEKILKEIDRAAASSRKTRSAIVREAVKAWLDRKRIQDFEDQWIKKLIENPEELEESEAWMKVDHWGDK